MNRLIHFWPLLLLLALTACNSLLFYPDPDLVLTPTQLKLQSEDVYIQSGEAKLHGWWLPAQGHAKGTILFSHGNAENISTHIASVYWLPAQGYNVLLFDYRGYGQSTGTPDLPGIHQDFAAALDYVFHRPDVDKQQIFVFGQSLGAAVALVACANSPYKNQLRAIIVEGAFSSYRQIAKEKLNDSWFTWALQWPLSFTISDEFRPIDAIAQLSPTPLLLIHSESDEVVPFHHATELFAAAREPKQFWRMHGIAHIHTFNIKENQQRLVAYLEEHRRKDP